jgi:hypothetical protein
MSISPMQVPITRSRDRCISDEAPALQVAANFSRPVANPHSPRALVSRDDGLLHPPRSGQGWRTEPPMQLRGDRSQGPSLLLQAVVGNISRT